MSKTIIATSFLVEAGVLGINVLYGFLGQSILNTQQVLLGVGAINVEPLLLLANMALDGHVEGIRGQQKKS